MLTELRAERERQGILQWRLASMANVSAGKLSMYETGRLRCPADVRHRIADALKKKVNELFPEYEKEVS